MIFCYIVIGYYNCIIHHWILCMIWLYIIFAYRIVAQRDGCTVVTDMHLYVIWNQCLSQVAWRDDVDMFGLSWSKPHWVRRKPTCSAKAMARSRFASLLLLAAVACFVGQLSNAFLPSPQAVARSEMQQAQGAVVAAGLAAASMPTPAFAARVEEEDEGFDLRILAVLALPLFAVSWALFNVWRVAFRQVVRIQDSEKGNPLWVAKDTDFCKDRTFSTCRQVSLFLKSGEGQGRIRFPSFVSYIVQEFWWFLHPFLQTTKHRGWESSMLFLACPLSSKYHQIANVSGECEASSCETSRIRWSTLWRGGSDGIFRGIAKSSLILSCRNPWNSQFGYLPLAKHQAYATSRHSIFLLIHLRLLVPRRNL